MRRYWLPDFERQLIGELQRQQNSTQFCDTLLQTEGISIPTHSSVLAALSLHLSQRLSACPPPPSGHKRKLQLHTLKPETLIKLVGLLYSGELEVNSALEQQDILAAAQLFGLPDLVEGQKTVGELDPCTEKGRGRVEIRKRDAQVQAQMITEVLYKRCVSTGTQTLTEDTEQTIAKSQHQQAAHSFSLPHNWNVSEMFQAENETSDTLSSTACPTFPRILGSYSDGELTLDQSSDSLTNAEDSHILSSSENVTLYLSPSEDSDSSSLQGGDIQQNLPESSSGSDKNSLVLEEDGTRDENMSENREKTSQANRDGTVGVEKRHISTNVSRKSLEKMHQVMKATQISIKVKLRRRRTKEEMWEVVNMQDADQSLSVVTSLRQDGSNCKRPQDDHTAVQSSPTTTHVCHSHDLVTSVLQPTTSSPKTHPQPSVTSNSCPIDILNQNTGVVSAPGPTEETDEQIEKLLEDIMIGLNIFPSVDKDNTKSHNGGPATCPVPKNTVLHCVYYQDCVTQSGHSSADTAQNSPACTSLPPAEPSGASVLSPTPHSSSFNGRDGSSNCKLSACQEFPACHDSTSQEDPNNLEFLPLSNENGDQWFSMADLQFPPCLSPLESVYDYSTSQSALPGQAWLMENPGPLVFPLSTVEQNVNSSVVSKHCTTEDSCKDTCQIELHTDGTQKRKTESPPSNSQLVKNPRKVNRNLRKYKAYDMTNAPPDRNSKSTNVEMNETCREVRVRANAKINLSSCLVSLSSNNVLAEDRKRVISSLKTPPNTADEPPSHRFIITRSISLRARATGENLKNTSNETRGALRNVQETLSHTTLANVLPCPVPSGTEIQMKRKRGRPRKTQSINLTSPDSATPFIEKNRHNEENEQHIQNPNLEETAEAKPTCRKRKRRKSVEERPLKQMVSTDPQPDDNNNTNQAEKRSRMIRLEEFQELIETQHLKTCALKEKCEKEVGEAAEREGGAPRTETIQETENSHSEDVVMTDVCDGQAEISSRQFVNQSGNAHSLSPVDDSSSPKSDKDNSAGNEHQSVFSFGVLQKEVAKLLVEKECSLETSHDDCANESEVNPLAPQLNTASTANHILNSNIVRKSDASVLREAGSTDRSLGCQQDDDDEEIDVLSYSPDLTSVNVECNKAGKMSPNEEQEEEDSSDIDVTG